ncbi:WD40-repeat-containing domain protein [Flammula alnicola]|nr:WD40-repeat-containing domain protein [Flammula alnicola]
MYDASVTPQLQVAAVLACSFSPDASRAYSGSLDTSVRELDLTTEKITNLGTHDDSVSSMTFTRSTSPFRHFSSLLTHTLRFWDLRASIQRVYAIAIDHVNHTLVVAMASRLFHIYDVRKMDVLAQKKESSLKYMTRLLACMSDGQGYATASVEGRIAVEYFDPSSIAQEKKYAFKCHRQTIDDVDHVWPIDSLAFHPVYNTFASAGSDGTVLIWDHKVKKRLRLYPNYTWDEGEAGWKASRVTLWVGVRKVGDEVKPKSWTGN